MTWYEKWRDVSAELEQLKTRYNNLLVVTAELRAQRNEAEDTADSENQQLKAENKRLLNDRLNDRDWESKAKRWRKQGDDALNRVVELEGKIQAVKDALRGHRLVDDSPLALKSIIEDAAKVIDHD